MLRRKIMEKLLYWKDDKHKRALLVTGARQIGKTWIIRQFAREQYKHFLELNFLEDPNARDIFSGSLDANTIITALTAYTRASLVPHETLVFFDEIQECPQARTAIKFLVEDGRFDYIESGSLLGVRSGEATSYPVGYEKLLQMFPLDLEEFSWATGIQPEVLDHVRTAFENRTPVHPAIHARMSRIFRLYAIVGGMPAAVQEYVNSYDMRRVLELQQDILGLYRLDIAKYADGEKSRVQDIFDRIPSQLDDKNRRFNLADINKSARYNRYEDSFLWLRDAGVALPCYAISEPTLPLRCREKRSLFKLFMGDTGLLCAASMGNIQFDILHGNLAVNMGSILENVFAQIFTVNGFPLWYFNKPKYGEIDFMLQKGRACLPIEIKSGKDYRRHAALSNVLNVSEWALEQGIVFCHDNVSTAGKVHYLPWYMAMFLKPPKPISGIVYEDFSQSLEELTR